MSDTRVIYCSGKSCLKGFIVFNILKESATFSQNSEVIQPLKALVCIQQVVASIKTSNTIEHQIVKTFELSRYDFLCNSA